jgi:hypothetical protein
MYTFSPDGGTQETAPWGYGMALYVAARYGDKARAEELAQLIPVRLPLKRNDKTFDARQYAFVLCGLAAHLYGE